MYTNFWTPNSGIYFLFIFSFTGTMFLGFCLIPRFRSYKRRDSVYLIGDTWASEVMMNTYEDRLHMQRTPPIMISGGPNIRYSDEHYYLVLDNGEIAVL